MLSLAFEEEEGVAEISISSVYRFLYLMKNNIIYVVHGVQFCELWGGGKRAFHSFTKYTQQFQFGLCLPFI